METAHEVHSLLLTIHAEGLVASRMSNGVLRFFCLHLLFQSKLVLTQNCFKY